MGQTKDQLSRRRRKLTPLPTAPVLTSEQTEAQKNNLSQQLQQQNQSAAENGLRNTTAGRVKQGSVAPEQAIQPRAKQTPEPQPLVITPKEDNVLTADKAAAERNRVATDTQAALTQNHPEEVKRLNYEAMTKMLNEQGEQGRTKKAEDEEKRRRRKQLFNAIGDGVAALSNLYFTTQGAPSVQYDPRGSLSARSQARWDAIDANRKAEEEKAYVLQQQAMDRALKEAKERRDEQRQAEIDRKNDEYRQKQLDQQAQYRAQNLELQRYRADLEAQAKKEGFQNKKELEEYKQGQLNARANVKQGGSSGNTPIYLQSGEVINVPSKAMSSKENVSRIYNAFPDWVKEAAFEKYNLGKYNDKKQLTPTQMSQIIGEYIGHPDAAEAQNIIRELAGTRRQGLGWGKASNSNSNETDW